MPLYRKSLQCEPSFSKVIFLPAFFIRKQVIFGKSFSVPSSYLTRTTPFVSSSFKTFTYSAKLSSENKKFVINLFFTRSLINEDFNLASPNFYKEKKSQIFTEDFTEPFTEPFINRRRLSALRGY